MIPLSRPLKFGIVTRKVGVSIPEPLLQRAREEQLNMSEFVVRCLSARYNEGKATIDQYSGSSDRNEVDRWSFLYESWKEYQEYLQMISPRRMIRKQEDLPPYGPEDRKIDQWILRRTEGKRVVTCGYMRKHWREILKGREEYERRLSVSRSSGAPELESSSVPYEPVIL